MPTSNIICQKKSLRDFKPLGKCEAVKFWVAGGLIGLVRKQNEERLRCSLHVFASVERAFWRVSWQIGAAAVVFCGRVEICPGIHCFPWSRTTKSSFGSGHGDAIIKLSRLQLLHLGTDLQHVLKSPIFCCYCVVLKKSSNYLRV